MEFVDIFNTDKKYSVIYADPAWKFKNKKTGGSMNSAANQKYTVTSIDDMCALPVSALANKNCLLVMWYVGSMPEEAIRLCKAWVFRVCNMNGFVWDKETANGKDAFGMGFSTRPQTESAIIAVRGKITDLIKCHSVRQKIRAKKGKHSEKPNEFRVAIKKLTGDAECIELFARHHFDGWDCWGNEC